MTHFTERTVAFAASESGRTSCTRDRMRDERARLSLTIAPQSLRASVYRALQFWVRNASIMPNATAVS
jgi:hypothetical protein